MARLKEESHYIEARVAEVEAGIEGVRGDVRSLTASMDRVIRAVDRLSQDVQTQQKTPWGSMGTWAGALLVLIGGIATPYVFQLREQDAVLRDMRYNQGRFEEHNLSQDQNAARREKRIDDLDTRIREIETRKP
jgi:hypothetical protein